MKSLRKLILGIVALAAFSSANVFAQNEVSVSLDSGFVNARLGCPVGTGDPGCDDADANHDGVVDPLDSGFVLARFGPCD